MAGVVRSGGSILAENKPHGGSLPFLRGLWGVIKEWVAGEICSFVSIQGPCSAAWRFVFLFLGSQGSLPHSVTFLSGLSPQSFLPSC